MGEEKCQFCSKVLSKEKGELDHGCLDCAGCIYMDHNGNDFCIHCMTKENELLKYKLEKAKEVIQFFADDETWQEPEPSDPETGYFDPAAHFNMQEYAKKALEGLE